jgi:hypothetical protein
MDENPKFTNIRDRVEMLALTSKALEIPLARHDQDKVDMLKMIDAVVEGIEGLNTMVKTIRNNNPIEGVGSDFYIRNEERATAYENAAARIYHRMWYALEDFEKKED